MTEIQKLSNCVGFISPGLEIWILDFEFVSEFGFPISNLFS
jgi:hypothetical protein